MRYHHIVQKSNIHILKKFIKTQAALEKTFAFCFALVIHAVRAPILPLPPAANAESIYPNSPKHYATLVAPGVSCRCQDIPIIKKSIGRREPVFAKALYKHSETASSYLKEAKKWATSREAFESPGSVGGPSDLRMSRNTS